VDGRVVFSDVVRGDLNIRTVTIFSNLFINLATISDYSTEFNVRKTRKGYMENDLKGSGRGLNEVLWQNLHAGTEEKPQNAARLTGPRRVSSLAPLKHRYRESRLNGLAWRQTAGQHKVSTVGATPIIKGLVSIMIMHFNLLSFVKGRKKESLHNQAVCV
jgi:hypothetical protein